MLQLHGKEGGLQFIQAGINPGEIMVVLHGGTIIAEHPDFFRDCRIIRDDGAGVSEGAKVGMKAPLNEMITALIHAKEQTY